MNGEQEAAGETALAPYILLTERPLATTFLW